MLFNPSGVNHERFEIMTRNGSSFLLVGLGELLWDLLPGGKQLGGAPANFAYHCQALGAEAALVSAVGSDAPGREILDDLKGHGLDLAHVATLSEHPTGTVSVEIDDEGKPKYVIHEGVAWDAIPSSPELLDLASRADAVGFGSLAQRSEASRATIRAFLKATRPDCLRVFDINLRQAYYGEEVVRESLKLSNVLKLNDEELPVVGEMLSLGGTEREILDALTAEFSLDAIALTRGGDGCLLHTPDAVAEHGGFAPERIADTVGAGDSFTAAFVMGLLRGDGLDTICEQANRLAAFVCSQKGAMSEMKRMKGEG